MKLGFLFFIFLFNLNASALEATRLGLEHESLPDFTVVKEVSNVEPSKIDLLQASESYNKIEGVILNYQFTNYLFDNAHVWINEKKELLVNSEYLDVAIDWESLEDLSEQARRARIQALTYFNHDYDSFRLAYTKELDLKLRIFMELDEKKKKKLNKNYKKLLKDKRLEPIRNFYENLELFLESTTVLPTYGLSRLKKIDLLLNDALLYYVTRFQKDNFDSRVRKSPMSDNVSERYNRALLFYSVVPDAGVVSNSFDFGSPPDIYRHSVSELKFVHSSLVLLSLQNEVCQPNNYIYSDHVHWLARGYKRHRLFEPERYWHRWLVMAYDKVERAKKTFFESCK